MFVRAILEEAVNSNGILIFQNAVTWDIKGNASAMVVTNENIVEQRAVAVGSSVGDKWMIVSGLSEGDRVIVKGMNKVKIGDKVISKDMNIKTALNETTVNGI